MVRQKVKRAFFSDFYLRMSAGRRVAYLGVFIALAVVANIASIEVTASLKITFTYVVAFFSGTFLGPLLGFAVCFFGDAVAFLLPTGGGVYWPLTGVCSGLLALIPGFVMNCVHFRFRGGVYVKTLISVVLMYLLVSCSLGAYSNYLYVKYVVYAGKEYTTLFGTYLAGKLLFTSVVSLVNYVLVFLLIPVINSIKPLKIRIE